MVAYRGATSLRPGFVDPAAAAAAAAAAADDVGDRMTGFLCRSILHR